MKSTLPTTPNIPIRTKCLTLGLPTNNITKRIAKQIIAVLRFSTPIRAMVITGRIITFIRQPGLHRFLLSTAALAEV